MVGRQQEGRTGSKASGHIRGPDKLGFLGLERAIKQVLWEEEGFFMLEKVD